MHFDNPTKNNENFKLLTVNTDSVGARYAARHDVIDPPSPVLEMWIVTDTEEENGDHKKSAEDR